MSNITPDEYHIAAKVCDAEDKPISAREFRIAAARLIAKEVSGDVVELAVKQHDELCAHRKHMGWASYKPWDQMPEDIKLERYVGIRSILAQLHSTGRLIYPVGGAS